MFQPHSGTGQKILKSPDQKTREIKVITFTNLKKKSILSENGKYSKKIFHQIDGGISFDEFFGQDFFKFSGPLCDQEVQKRVKAESNYFSYST